MVKRDMITDSIRELELSRAEVMLQLHDFNEADNSRGVVYCEEALRWIGNAIKELQAQL